MADKYGVERIDTKEFETALSEIDIAVKLFISARKKIIGGTDPLVDSWKGEGAASFGKVYRKLKIELEDEEINLTNLRDDLKCIKESYEGWDLDVKTHLQYISQ